MNPGETFTITTEDGHIQCIQGKGKTEVPNPNVLMLEMLLLVFVCEVSNVVLYVLQCNRSDFSVCPSSAGEAALGQTLSRNES